MTYRTFKLHKNIQEHFAMALKGSDRWRDIILLSYQTRNAALRPTFKLGDSLFYSMGKMKSYQTRPQKKGKIVDLQESESYLRDISKRP